MAASVYRLRLVAHGSRDQIPQVQRVEVLLHAKNPLKTFEILIDEKRVFDTALPLAQSFSPFSARDG
jgi:hypothetical protein